jgi:RNAse (barnase) inhibitor barstar
MTKSLIARIVRGEMSPGVYHSIDPMPFSELETLAAVSRSKLFYFDGDRIVDRASLFAQFAIVMRFPEHFGHNWDALADCLTDLNVDEGEVDRYIIVIDRLDNFATQDPQQWTNFIDVCKSTVEYWQDTTTPMQILLRWNYPHLARIGLTWIQ